MHDSVLVVDDEVDITRTLARLLRQDHFTVFTANSANEAIKILEKEQVKVVISDQRMPKVSGSEFLSQVKRSHPETVRMVLSGYSDFKSLSDAINQGDIYKFLLKPWDNALLLAEIKSALALHDLKSRNIQLNSLFNSTIEAIVLCTREGAVNHVNPAFTKLTGLAFDDIANKHFSYLFRSETKVSTYAADAWHGECFCIKKDSGEIPIWLNSMILNMIPNTKNNMALNGISPDNSDAAFAFMFIDISDQKAKEARIEHQAYHDELTGLPNRRLLKNHLQLALHQRSRDQGNVGLLFMDLDRFKHINDSLGHDVGDALLREVTIRLNDLMRKGDTLSRFGGDEFVILLPAVKEISECQIVAEKIIHSFTQVFICNNHQIHVQPSIGISFSSHGEIDCNDLLRHADAAMYKAKRNGGNQFSHFRSSEEDGLHTRVETEAALRKGVERNEFAVYFQPQVNLFDGIIRSCEALVRWDHPEKGVLAPGNFIEIAEQTGLIHEIGLQVLKASCSEYRRWRNDYGIDCKISVNLSANQFKRGNLAELITNAISEAQIETSDIELEVTETALLTDINQSIETLKTLRNNGFEISLDDFGTGYSSLSYLQRLPISTVKIDQSFIRDIPSKKRSMVIVSGTIKMAKRLHLNVVAEGVETHEQFEFLKNCGCDIAQGYFISRPLSKDSFIRFISGKSQSIDNAKCNGIH